jgi:hypothetical protein
MSVNGVVKGLDISNPIEFDGIAGMEIQAAGVQFANASFQRRLESSSNYIPAQRQIGLQETVRIKTGSWMGYLDLVCFLRCFCRPKFPWVMMCFESWLWNFGRQKLGMDSSSSA